MENLVTSGFFNRKKILITGDTGFKGSWLALWLKTLGADVYGYALPAENNHSHFKVAGLNSAITHFDGNLLDYELLKRVFDKIQPEIVFHLAAQALVRYSYNEPKLTFDTNVSGSVNILEIVRNSDSVKSLVYVTSDKCYKNKEWIWGYRENDELGGHDPYSASKAAAEIVFASYVDSFFYQNPGIGLGSVRAGNVIGGGDWAEDRIVPDCIRSLMNNSDIVIRNPKSVRPWQHVLEPLYGYLLLAMNLYENPKDFSGSWNFGPEIDSFRTVHEIANKIICVFGKGKLSFTSNDKNKLETNLLHLNCDKAICNLGWKPVWDFETSVKRTAEWYKNYLMGTDPQSLSLKDINQFMEDKQND